MKPFFFYALVPVLCAVQLLVALWVMEYLEEGDGLARPLPPKGDSLRDPAGKGAFIVLV